MDAAPRAALRLDAVREQCAEDGDSAELRQAHMVSIIVGSIARVGRLALIMPSDLPASCGPDGE